MPYGPLQVLIGLCVTRVQIRMHCFQLDAASAQPHVSHHRSDPHDSQDLMPGQPPRLEHGPVFQNMLEEIGDGVMTSSTHET